MKARTTSEIQTWRFIAPSQPCARRDAGPFIQCNELSPHLLTARFLFFPEPTAAVAPCLQDRNVRPNSTEVGHG